MSLSPHSLLSVASSSSSTVISKLLSLQVFPYPALPQQCASMCPQVPLISIMATGGGTRSMTAMYGHLLGLQKLNILNCASYITGLSGATW